MFLIRRKCTTSRDKLWKVASLLKQICSEYEEKGRSKATIYVSGWGTPSNDYSVSAEWTQEKLESNNFPNVPDKIRNKLSEELQNNIEKYEIEFHEVVTNEKLRGRGL
ncbi:MAG: hypothetical protein CL893_04590 [Dehalococcoidia bacterium]|nr:hypothetical protein [Dehalococcoidia bacterium]|tara:strand:- start:10705 stop:11028 length:324 start_codon:yes stop_codon:yes gene_type:complete